MLRQILFWTVLIGLTLLPSCLILLGKQLTKRRTENTAEDSSDSEVYIARALAWIAASTPPLQLLFSTIPSRLIGNLPVVLFLTMTVLAVFAGLAAAVMFLITARSFERIIGPGASVLASVLAFLFFWAEMAGA